MSNTFKVGFIGAGGIALMHMTHLKRIPNVEIPCAADVSDKSLAKAQETHGVQRVYKDYHEMLRVETDIDAVSICTPNGLHAENTIAALEAGKHVMVEKPMALHSRECVAMIETAHRVGKKLICGFQFRFDPRTQLIRKQIAEGHFGKILYVRCQALRRRGIPNWGVFGRKDLQGGGPMIDIGVHVMEMAHYAIGSPRPITATGNTWTFLGNTQSEIASAWPGWDYKNYTVEDMAAGMVRFDNGCLMTIEASFVAHIEKDVWNFQVMGEKGGAVWESAQVFRDQDGYMMNLNPGFLPSSANNILWDLKMQHFVDVCRAGRLNESSGEHGMMVQKMIDGIYASADAGREVMIE